MNDKEKKLNFYSFIFLFLWTKRQHKENYTYKSFKSSYIGFQNKNEKFNGMFINIKRAHNNYFWY